MADVDCPGVRLMIARWWERKHQFNIRVQLWLIFFDDHDVIASAISNGLCHMPLGQQGIHGEHPTR